LLYVPSLESPEIRVKVLNEEKPAGPEILPDGAYRTPVASVIRTVTVIVSELVEISPLPGVTDPETKIGP
jgi:hypothetical protein